MNATCVGPVPSCCAGVENLCLDNIDHSGWGVLFELVILLYAFVSVAIVADEHLVVSLETLCVRWNVREDVAGASFMAFGSAAPEIIINAISTIKSVAGGGDGGGVDASDGLAATTDAIHSALMAPHSDLPPCTCDDTCSGDDEALGIGAIIGSGMIAFTFIPGCCGLAASQPLELKRRPLGRDILAYSLALVMLLLAISDGRIEPGESAMMVLIYTLYILLVIFSSRIRETYRVKYLGRAARSKSSFVIQGQEALNPSLQSDHLSVASATAATPLSSAVADLSGESGGLQPLPTPTRDPAGEAQVPAMPTIIQGLEPTWRPMIREPTAVIGPQPNASAAAAASSGALPAETESVSTFDGLMPDGTSVVARSGQPRVTFDITAIDTFTAGAGGGGGGDAAAGGLGSSPPERALRALASFGDRALAPLKLALSVTCPECAHDSPSAHLYPVTLATSFTWVALLSTIIAAVVSRWGVLMCLPSSFLGMYVVAIGAEIPDTVQSVTVAKRGYGSMAVSNSTGSQIINILIGLGLPWLITNMAGRTVNVHGVGSLRVMASFQTVNVAIYFSLLLLPTIHTWRPGDHSKASLGKRKGRILMVTYVTALTVCAPILLAIKDTST